MVFLCILVDDTINEPHEENTGQQEEGTTQPLGLLSKWSSAQTSSKTYSNAPPPGMGKAFVKPSSSITASTALRTVDPREMNSFHRKPSWISGTRRKENVRERNGCSDTRRSVGV